MEPARLPSSLAASPAVDVPLVVDLDGTLVRTDTLHEALLLLVRTRPAHVLRVPAWLLGGKAAFKRTVASLAQVPADELPFDARVIAMLQEARAAGRRTVLATAADVRVAQAVAEHLGLFDEVIATHEANLAAGRKGEALVARFGERGFDYVGNARADAAVWERARRAIAVNAPAALARRLQRTHPQAHVVPSPAMASAGALLRACRPYQWVKNLLVFVPMAAAHALTADTLGYAAVAFLAFGLAASASYLCNDLLDLAADRRHPRKRHRPFASGDAVLAHGAVAALVLFVAAFALAAALGSVFALYLAVYVVVTALYSWVLKQVALLDVMIVASLYTVRIMAGGAATHIPVSLWLLGFAMFLFTSLAFAKRYAETRQLEARQEQAVARRGYRAGDSAVLMALGTAAGMAAVVMLALYVNSAASAGLYRTPAYLWGLCPLLLYWLGRIWLAAQRDVLTDDPIVFALTDRPSLVVLLLALVPIALAAG